MGAPAKARGILLMGKAINQQDMFLNQARKEGVQITIYLMGGVQLRGTVKGFDAFTVLLNSPGKPSQLVYKHAITSIVPAQQLGSPYRHDDDVPPPSPTVPSED